MDDMAVGVSQNSFGIDAALQGFFGDRGDEGQRCEQGRQGNARFEGGGRACLSKDRPQAEVGSEQGHAVGFAHPLAGRIALFKA